MASRRMVRSQGGVDWDINPSTTAGRRLGSPAWLWPYGCVQAMTAQAGL